MPDIEMAINRAVGEDSTECSRRRWLPRTLFARFLTIIVTPLVLTQLVATWIFYDRHWETVTRRLSFAVVGEIALVVGELERLPHPDDRQALLQRVQEKTDLAITFMPGERLDPGKGELRGMLPRILSRDLRDLVRHPFRINTKFTREWYEIRIQLLDGVLRVLTPERRLFSPTSYIFILWMTGSALVLFTIAIVFMRNQIRSIRRLAFAADSFGKGRDVEGFKPEGAQEVRQVAVAFLVMRERIQRQMRQRTEMLAGVSHDLRTPLTRMKLALAMLGDGNELEELKSDVAEMEAMIEAYLSFVRGESGEPVETIDLGRLLEEVVGNARRGGGDIDFSPPPNLWVPLRVGAMRRCLTNLLANARRHARHISVRAGCVGASAVEIVIDDDGPGIPPYAREDVFKPFFRLDSSRNPETGGTGLGLSIARDIARGHGGDIVLLDSPLGGLEAVIRLPL